MDISNPYVVSAVTFIVGIIVRELYKPIFWPVKNSRIKKIIANRVFTHIFNPYANPIQSKEITFESKGTVGKGRNANENTWRVRRGKLEIYNINGELYSSFALKDYVLHHTNDPKTLSIPCQRIERKGEATCSLFADAPVVTRRLSESPDSVVFSFGENGTIQLGKPTGGTSYQR